MILSYKSPRRRDTDLFADDGDTQEQCMKDQENKNMKAKKMKADSYLQYRAKFGDDSMRSMIGGKQTGRDELDQENGNYSPERRNRSRTNRPKDTDLFPGDPDERQCEELKNAKNAKAEKMKHESYLQFRTKHGDSFMRSMLGGNDRGPSVEEAERENLNLHWDASPRRRRESPRRKDADLFNSEVDTSKGNEELKIKQLQAEKMKAQNELRYRDKFGYNLMKQTLGGCDEQEENEQPSSRNNRRTGRTSSRRGRHGQSRNRRPGPIGYTSRKNSSDRFANIDHTARSEKMKALKPLQHKHIYGDDFMRSMVGGNPREQQTEQPLEPEIRYFDQDNGGNRGVENMENIAPYSPSWNDNEQRAQ